MKERSRDEECCGLGVVLIPDPIQRKGGISLTYFIPEGALLYSPTRGSVLRASVGVRNLSVTVLDEQVADSD